MTREEGLVMKILKKDFKNYLLLNELNKLSDIPKYIYIEGSFDILNMQSLAVIGSRRISTYGIKVIKELVPDVSRKNIVIVSGVAEGCDYLAQKTSIESGGTTIGILGGGLNLIKNHKYAKFMRQIIEDKKGAIISEFEPSEPPAKWTFIKRNRIIASLGQKLLVIEAAQKSGTMHTVNFALEMGKDILSVPGNIYNNNSEGTNKLIKDGAIVVTSSADILGEYFEVNDYVPSINPEILKRHEKLLEFIRNEKTINEVSKELNIPIGQLLSVLTTLEMQGIISRIGDKWVRGR